MRSTIFLLENQKSFKEEYQKMLKVLSSKCITFQKKDYNYFDFINQEVFHNWKYRGTYINVYDYLDSIGVSIKSKRINKESFLNLLEFILNMQFLMNSLKYYTDNLKVSIPCKSILVHNIPIILDSLGYTSYSLEDRVIILEKDVPLEEMMKDIGEDFEECFISYRNQNNNGIKMKRIILLEIYHLLEKDSEKYKSLNSTIYNSIKQVVTKLGIIGEIDKKYQNLSNYKLRKYYDNCFEMMVYLVKTEKIMKIKDQIKSER